MEILLEIAGGLLGILVPFLFFFTLRKGIDRTDLDDERKADYKRILGTAVGLGTVLIWVLSLSKVLNYHEGDVVPRFAIPLVVIVFTGICIAASRDFQTILASTPLPVLVGVQAFRLAGIAFFVIAYLKILPGSFQIAAYGDLLTGILAIIASRALQNNSSNARLYFWLFNVVGLFDLVNVAVLLLLHYPLWSDTLPTSEAATQFSLVMIPALAAPFAMLLHFYSMVAAVRPREL